MHYLKLAGAGFVDTPDDASLHVTGDLSIAFGPALTDWTPGSLEIIVRKTLAASQASFQVFIGTDGKINLQWSTDGAALAHIATSTVAPTIADGSPLAVLVELDVDNGAGGCDIKFYTKATAFTTAFADVTATSGWTQLGTTVTQAGTTSIFAGTAPLKIGATESATFGIVGKVAAVVIRNGLAGTVVADPDFTTQPIGTTSFTDAASRTWTLHGDAVFSSDENAEVTQEYVEVVQSSADNARITQEYVEVVQSSQTNARVTQEYVEVIFSASNVSTEVTQEYVEVVQSAGSTVLPTPTPPVGDVPETPEGTGGDTDVWASF